MKTKLSPTKARLPLSGSILRLTATLMLGLTPLAAPAEEGVRSSRRAPAQQKDAPQEKGQIRSSEEAVRAGIDYLLTQQAKSGGWKQGGGWRQNKAQGASGRVEGANVEDPADLGNTCVSLMALLRAGHTPAAGEHKAEAQRAFEYLCQQVEAADAESLWVTSVRDTQLQVKIGTYVDTFLSGWVLSELKGHLANEEQEKRRADALQKVVAKIEKHQQKDGSVGGNQGWAAVLSQGLCSKALNSASRSGAKVSEKALQRDNVQNAAGLDVASGDFKAPTAATEPSSAGVSLYRETAKLNGLQERWRSNNQRLAEVQQRAADPSAAPTDKAEAKKELKQIAEDEKAYQAAQAGVAARSKQSQFVAGFGNNGGEEFLSYLNLGEAMRDRGGKDWSEWKTKMQGTICGAQNADGSWAGQHCITGRTFCTAAALLTLQVEKTPESKKLTENTAPEKSPAGETISVIK